LTRDFGSSAGAFRSRINRQETPEMTKLSTLMLAGAAAVALVAGAALAQNTAPMAPASPPAAAPAPAPMASPPAAAPAPMGNMPMAAPAPAASPAPMGNMPMGAKPMAKAKPKAKKMASKMASMKLTCGDYAWQSQDQKDCEAGKIKPPNWR
jgi:hypothetical protein